MRQHIERYATARKRWKAAGEPIRAAKEVEHILENVCKPCPLYRAVRRNLGQCKKCGCALNLGRKLNKLYWATEQCPDSPPRWLAKVVQDENGEWVENPEYQGESLVAEKKEPQEDAQQEPEESPRERRIRRRREREERQKAREKRAKEREKLGFRHPLVEFEPSNDNLRTYDRNSVYQANHPLRDYWRTCPAFLVCGGPSLNTIDISLLEHPGVVSMGVNNVAGYVRCKSFVYSDPTEKFHGGIFLNPGIMKFAPTPKLKNQIRLKKTDGTFEFPPLRVRQCPSVWGFDRNSEFHPEEFLTAPNASWGCSKTCPDETGYEKVLFTPFLGLRLLHYLGVRTVFLLGWDFNMEPGTTGGYAFNQGRTKGAASSNNAHYKRVHRMMDDLKPVFDDAGFQVYNCNPTSRLTTFPYYAYGDAVEFCKALLPPEPLDLSAWYEKDPAKAPSEDESSVA